MFAATVVVLVLFTFADAWMIQNHPNSVLVRSPIPFCHWKPHQKQRQSFSGVGVWKKGLFAKQNDDDDDDDRPAGPTPATAVAAATANVATTTATSRNQFQQQRHSSYWAHLQPKLKERIQKEGQERAMANKKKREPETDKKRRTYKNTIQINILLLADFFLHVIL